MEDDVHVRVLARTILRKYGYTSSMPKVGGTHFLLCEQYAGPIDLLLTDVVMPRMSGRQLAERLLAVRPEMKVLYMSGYTDDAVMRQGIFFSSVAFIQKPITPMQLARKVPRGSGVARHSCLHRRPIRSIVNFSAPLGWHLGEARKILTSWRDPSPGACLVASTRASSVCKGLLVVVVAAHDARHSSIETRVGSRIVAGSVQLRQGSKDKSPPAEKPSASAPAVTPPPPAPAPDPRAAQAADRLPRGVERDRYRGAAVQGRAGDSRMMEVKYTGKITDEGPKFSVVNKTKKSILYVGAYFYDKAGKQLQVTAGGKPRPMQLCSGNIFAGAVKPDEKIFVFFSCVKKDFVPEGTTAIEAEVKGVGFADESGTKNEFYWSNLDLIPDVRPKGGLKSKSKKK